MNETPPTAPTLTVIETEAALLGALLIDNAILDQVGDRLLSEHFADPLHARFYKTIVLLRAAGDKATPITLLPYFRNEQFYDADGHAFDAIGYLAGLTGSGAGLIGATQFADQIIQFATYRTLRSSMQAGIASVEALDQGIPDALAIAAETSSAMLKAVESRNPHKLVSMGNTLRRVRARRDRAASGASIGAICASIPDVNDLIGPAAPGQMTVIGGRSGMGKTIFANSMAWGYAVNGHPTLVISMELTADVLAMRSAADFTFAMNEPVLFGDMIRNTVNDSDLATIDEAADRIDRYPLTTLTPGRLTIEQLEGFVAREVARLAREGKTLEVLVVDYIQIMIATGRLEGTARINHISEGLLGIAQRYSLHVFALSQLLREIDKRPDRRPTVADLKESGRLEEDSDNVLLIYREEHYLVKERPDPKDTKKYDEWDEALQACRGRADLMAVKSRSNEPDTRKLRFYGKHQAMRGSTFQLPNFRDEGVLLPADGKPPRAANDDSLDFSKMAVP